MYEIAAFVNRRRVPMQLSIIKNPVGTFHFVGTGPMELFYEGPADAIETGRKFGFGLVRHLGVRARTWPTAEEAKAAADALGVPVVIA